MTEKHRDPELEQIPELLDAVAEKIPALLKGIRDVFYTKEAGQEMGQAVGAFYKELLANDMDPEEAVALTKAYMNTLQQIPHNMNIKSDR